MTRKLNKDRVFRHMARDVPDYKIVRLYRDELLDFEWSHTKEDPSKWFIEKYLGWWIRLTKIKYGENVLLDLYSDFDIDYNAYRLGGRIMPEKYRRAAKEASWNYGITQTGPSDAFSIATDGKGALW